MLMIANQKGEAVGECEQEIIKLLQIDFCQSVCR